MKINKIKFFSCIAISTLMMFFTSCEGDSIPSAPEPKPRQVIPQEPVITFSGTDLSQFTSESNSEILMQAFYWDVVPRGGWYDEVSTKVEDWADNGVNSIWLPPPGKGQSGGFSMGYDPCDYHDLGEFNQHGTIETRFGSKAELIALIENAHDNDLEVIADIVLNHNSGGQSEFNPNIGENTFTKFESASGFFPRTFDDYYPDSEGNVDEGVFGGFADLNHSKPNVQKWLWQDENSVAKYYKRIGFDGWRFDFVKGFDPKWIKAWNAEVGGTSIGENFDGNASNLRAWTAAAESAAFDFACYFKLVESLTRNNDLRGLAGDMLRKTNPELAYTFAGNHDFDNRPDVGDNDKIFEENKLYAYAYILTHDGIPTIFYSDYENENLKKGIQTLMKIHKTIASGDVTVVEASKDIYVMRREGSSNNPGLVLTINISENEASIEVDTNWNSKRVFDYTENNSTVSPTTDANGKVTLPIPPNSYGVWSVAE